MTKNELAKEVAVSEKLHLSTTFQPTECKERPARDFKTGKPVVIPAHKSAKFRVSKDFIKFLNAEAGKEATV